MTVADLIDREALRTKLKFLGTWVITASGPDPVWVHRTTMFEFLDAAPAAPSPALTRDRWEEGYNAALIDHPPAHPSPALTLQKFEEMARWGDSPDARMEYDFWPALPALTREALLAKVEALEAHYFETPSGIGDQRYYPPMLDRAEVLAALSAFGNPPPAPTSTREETP